MLYIVYQDCDGACHLKNYCFVITYLLEDEQELSLGMLDTSQTYLFAPPLHLFHPLFRRASDDGTVGLRNPASCEPVRVRGDQVFGDHFCATTDGITSIDDSFPEEDFFLNISSLYIDDMADANANANVNLNANANANLNVNVNPPAAPYAICSYLFQFLLQFLVLVFGIDVICLSMLDVICLSILLVCMIRLIPAIIIMFYYWLFWIKSYGKLLIFSTLYATDNM
jgi:hypothetical protein